MTLNMSELPEQELIRQIVERCGEFGLVSSVEILRDDPAATYQFAVVRMSTPTEASSLFMAMGTSKFDDSVVIRLEQSFS